MTTVDVEYASDIEAYHLKFEPRGRNSWDQIRGIIQVIKAKVPASDREYNATTKIWTITKAHYPGIETVLKLSGFHIKTVVTNKTTPPKQQDFFYTYSEPVSSSGETKESLADKLMKLLECTAQDLGDNIKLKRLYRAKALQYHPDRNNGDGSKMSELNSVWSAYNA